MSKKRLNLMLAGVLVACAFGAIVSRLARATPTYLVTGTTIAGPVVLDEIDVQSHSRHYGVKIKTKGLSDAYVTYRRIEPGGHSGWHSHPGPVTVLVTAGTTTVYYADDCTHTPAVYPAGTGFVEDVDRTHLLRNEGSTPLELVVSFLVPRGEAIRKDEPKPRHYPF
jgi:quercetin dioxygenase-like cupin family protein